MFVDNLFIEVGSSLEIGLIVNDNSIKGNEDESYIFIKKNDNFMGEKILKYFLNEDWKGFYKMLLWIVESSMNDFIDNKNIEINLYKESIEELENLVGIKLDVNNYNKKDRNMKFNIF